MEINNAKIAHENKNNIQFIMHKSV